LTEDELDAAFDASMERDRHLLEVEELECRVRDLEAAMRSAIESAEANGMGDWKQFAMLRNALKR
jgi:hypothetical protein